MLQVDDEITVSIQIIHNPKEPYERPEDVSYGTLKMRGAAAIPAVGDILLTDTDPDEKMPFPIVVLSRLFTYMSLEDAKNGQPRKAKLHVNIVGREATEHEMGRAIKE